MNRADHHADKVKGIALALLGGIVWRADPGSIEIRQHAGNLANVLWVTIQGSRYAFVYNHQAEKIELRERTQQGAVLHSFDDEMSVSEVEAIFRGL